MRGAKPKRHATPPLRAVARIDDLAPGGDGVAHAVVHGERRAVFVPRVAVGDEVELEVDVSARPARGKVSRLVRAGDGRVTPPCPFAESCGACDWMHLSRDAQRSARESHLRRALPAAWRDAPVKMHDDTPSEGYRTRAHLHARASGGRALVGPHRPSTHDIAEADRCLVLAPALGDVIPALAAVLHGAHGRGDMHVAIGLAGKPVADIHWDGRVPAALFARLEDLVASGAWAGARVFDGPVRRPAVVGDPAPRMAGADGQPLVLPAGGFAQASDEGNVELVRRVWELVQQTSPPRPSGVVELYSGAGNFTVLLASALERVVAVESDADACEAARTNLAARGLKARVVCADVEQFDIPRADLVVLDPPRRGARRACEVIAASAVKTVVYVSCDPPTLGRDLAALAGRFEPVAIESFAMFPGTSHAESVVALRRNDGGAGR
jgi:23S rRNA (uracil1939-C5)-methyltransferase